MPEDEQAEVIEDTQADSDPIKDITVPLDGLPDDAREGAADGEIDLVASNQGGDTNIVIFFGGR